MLPMGQLNETDGEMDVIEEWRRFRQALVEETRSYLAARPLAMRSPAFGVQLQADLLHCSGRYFDPSPSIAVLASG